MAVAALAVEAPVTVGKEKASSLITVESSGQVLTIIPHWLRKYLKSEDLKKISEAVQKAEITTDGEIVPMIVRSSELFQGRTRFWNFIARAVLPLSFHIKLVELRAELEFYRHYQNQTQNRTAILLFISLLERRAVVLADKAIAEKLPAETWSEVVHLMTSELKHKDLSTGFIRAIQKCSEILSHHFPNQKHNPNELCNQLVIKE